jgi:hypothetical protein
MGGRLPDTAVAVKERFRPRIEAVGSPQDLCLHRMCVFRGVNERLMQLVLRALAELAGLCSIAAVGVSLGLVHEDPCEQDACPPPDTVRPLNDLSKEVIPDTESDGEKPVSKKRKRESEGKDRDRASKSGGKRSRKKEVVELDTSGDDGQPAPNSRHLSVSASQIYMDWNGALLFAARRRFQTLIFSRDGAGLKSQAPANAMNFKLVLLAAKAVMPAKEYASFRDQMDRAYQNKDKS